MSGWTIGKKLYSGLGVLALVTMARAAAGIYAQSQMTVSIDLLASKVGPNIRHIGQMRYLAETFRAANRYSVILSSQRDTAGLETVRKKMEDAHAAFTKEAAALEQNTPVPEVKELARQSIVAMDAYFAGGMEIYQLAAEFKTADAAATVAKKAPLGNTVQEVMDKLLELQDGRLQFAAKE